MELLEHQSFHVILLDIHLPDSQGLTTLQKLVSASSDIPIVVLTSLDNSTLGVEAVREGAQDYLIKGQINYPLLERSLRYAIERFHHQQLQKQNEENLRKLVQDKTIELQLEILRCERIEVKLRQSEEKFRNTFEQAAVGLAHVSPNGTWVRVNRTLCSILGYSREELLGKTFQDVTHPDDLELDLFYANQLIAGEINHYSLEKRYIRKDGSIVWINLTGSLFRNRTGQPEYFIAVIEDITKRKQTQENLRESEEKFRQLAERINEVFFIRDPIENKMIYISPAYETIWQRSCESLYENANSWLDAIHPDDQNKVYQLAEQQKQGLSPDIEYRIVQQNGEIRWIFSRVFFIFDQKGNVNRIVGIAEDITRRKQAEIELQKLNSELEQRVKQRTQELQESEEKFRQLAETLDEVFFLQSIDAKEMLYVSPAYEGIWGRTCQSLYEHPESWLEAIYPEDRERVLESISQFRSNEGKITLEYRIVRPNGEVRWISSRAFFVRNSEGRPDRYAGIAQDITQQKQAEFALRESEARFQSLADNLPGVIYQYVLYPDFYQEMTYLSSGCYDLFELAPETVLENFQAIENVVHPDDLLLLRESTAISAKTLAPWQCDFRVILPSGNVKWIQGASRPTSQPNGEIIWDGILLDITQSKQFQKELEDSQRFIERVADASPNILYIYDIEENRNVYVNREIYQMLGYTPKQVQAMGANFLEKVMHPDDYQKSLKNLPLLYQLSDHEVFEFEYRMKNTDGEWRWLFSRDTVYERTRWYS
ncbi:MAG: PAS domain-containing protein [Halothece sp.]